MGDHGSLGNEALLCWSYRKTIGCPKGSSGSAIQLITIVAFSPIAFVTILVMCPTRAVKFMSAIAESNFVGTVAKFSFMIIVTDWQVAALCVRYLGFVFCGMTNEALFFLRLLLAVDLARNGEASQWVLLKLRGQAKRLGMDQVTHFLEGFAIGLVAFPILDLVFLATVPYTAAFGATPKASIITFLFTPDHFTSFWDPNRGRLLLESFLVPFLADRRTLVAVEVEDGLFFSELFRVPRDKT